MERSESNTWCSVIFLQLGVAYVNKAAHKEVRGLTLGRRHQLTVLAGEDNMKGGRNKNTRRFLASNCTQIGQKFGMYEYKLCYALSEAHV